MPSLALCLLAMIPTATGAMKQSTPRPPDFETRLLMLGRSPAIRASINGRPAILEIDTGSFELRLNPSFVQNLPGDVRHVTLQIGTLNPVVVKPLVQDTGSSDEEKSRRHSVSKGIIGLDLLRRYAMGMDLAQDRIAFWEAPGPTDTDALAWVGGPRDQIQRLALDTKGKDDWFRIPVLIDGTPLHLLLDTGTAYSTVNPSLVNPLHLRIVGEVPVQEIGTTEKLQVAIANSVSFGGIEAQYPVLNVENDEDPDMQGIFGTESLGGARFVMDMPDKTLTIRPGPFHDHDPLDQRLHASGLEICLTAGNRVIAIVRRGGLAAQAGIESGDVFTTLGGMTVADIFGEPGSPRHWDKLMQLGFKSMQKNFQVQVQTSHGLVTLTLPSG